MSAESPPPKRRKLTMKDNPVVDQAFGLVYTDKEEQFRIGPLKRALAALGIHVLPGTPNQEEQSPK